jgi:hypothetical protein
MLYDEELARMRAQMLAKEEEEPPVFDDGARFLGQDPNMMQVGLFGRPKKPVAPPVAPPVNLQRRSILGLTPLPADLPAVIPPSAPRPTPQQIEQAVPQQQQLPTPAPSAPSASPLQALADKALNTPMSRRDVLKRAGQAALQQVVPMPSITDVVPQVMSPLAEIAKAAPAFDKSAIIGAVSSFLTDKMVDTSSDLAAELYDRGIWEPEDLNAADATTAWEYAQYGDEDHPEGLATLRNNFTLQKLSEHSGIPIEELKKHISDVELQGFPLSIGNNQERLSAIMEDGRPKEAYRMTAFEDLGPIDDYIRKSATELYGTQKSFDEDERWEIVNHAQGLVYDEYVRKTMNNIEMPEYGFHDEVLLKAGKDWLDEAFSSVFDQGLEYSGYTHDDFYAHLDNALKPKRASKPKVVKPKAKLKGK